MFALPSIVGLVLMISSGTVTDRLRGRGYTSRVVRIIVPAIGVLICGAVLVFLPSIGTPILAVAVVSIGYGFGAIAFPLINAAISELCPPQQTAGTMGVFLALMAVGGLVAPTAPAHRRQRCHRGRGLRNLVPDHRCPRRDRCGARAGVRQPRTRPQDHPRRGTREVGIASA